jgi:hypothetical protein
VPDIRVHVANTTEDDGVSVEPGTVSVSLNVRQADETLVIKEVPVSFGGAKSVLDVKVSGPPELIAQIREKPELVEAWLKIQAGDEDVGKVSKAVRFNLPAGVKVHPDDEKRTVEVTVTRRAAAG